MKSQVLERGLLCVYGGQNKLEDNILWESMDETGQKWHL